MTDTQSTRLGDVLKVKHGFAFPGEHFTDDPSYPTLVTPGNFALGGGFQETKTKTYLGEVSPDYLLDPGDLIVTMTDLSKSADTLGLPAIVPEGKAYLHNQRIGRVLIADPTKVDKRFLSYFLRTAAYRSYIVGTASGTTVRHTSPTRIEDYVAKLPLMDQQIAVAEVLGALDDKIAANTKVATTAIALASLSYDVAAKAIPVIAMSHALTPILGGTPARSRADFWTGEHPWISAKDVTNAPSGIVIETAETISAKAAASTKAKPLPIGSVILTARGTVGAVARLGMPSSFNQSCYGFVPGRLPAGVLYFAIQRASIQARSLAHGSVFDTITMKTFDHVYVPDPEAAGVRELNAKVEPLLDLVTSAVAENRSLAVTRDTLLPQLMSGELRIRDAERIVEIVA